MTQIIKFVDRVGGSTLLDISPGSSGVQVGDTSQSFPPPPIARSVAANPAQDGGSVPSALYGLRTVTLPLVYSAGVGGTPAALRRTQVQALMRVLQREDVWLEVRPDGGTESRWLHCYRSSDPTLTARLLGTAWAELTVTILADPFAYGPKESLGTLSTNVAGDLKTPVLAANVKGDVDAPLMVTWTPANDSLWRTLWIASGAGHTAGSIRCVSDLTGAGGTLPAGTTRATVATSIAVGGTYIEWQSVDPGQTYEICTQVVFTNGSGGSGPAPGTYRVFLLTVNGPTFIPPEEQWRARLLHNLLDATFNPTKVVVSDVAIAHPSPGVQVTTFNDLGLVDIPFAARPVAAGFDAATAVSDLTLTVELTMLAGNAASEFGVDAIIAIPADTSILALMAWSNVAGRKFIADPESGQVLTRSSADVNVPDMALTRMVGQCPIVSPINDTMLYAFCSVGPTSSSPSNAYLAAMLPASFDAAYWPRYLTVL